MTNVWHSLPFDQKHALVLYFSRCHGVTSVRDAQSGRTIGRAGLARHLNPIRSGVGFYRRDVALGVRTAVLPSFTKSALHVAPEAASATISPRTRQYPSRFQVSEADRLADRSQRTRAHPQAAMPRLPLGVLERSAQLPNATPVDRSATPAPARHLPTASCSFRRSARRSALVIGFPTMRRPGALGAAALGSQTDHRTRPARSESLAAQVTGALDRSSPSQPRASDSSSKKRMEPLKNGAESRVASSSSLRSPTMATWSKSS